MIIVGFMMAKLKKKCIRRIVFLRKMHEQMEIRRKCNKFLWKIGNLGGIGRNEQGIVTPSLFLCGNRKGLLEGCFEGWREIVSVAKKMKTLGVLQYSKSLFQIILDGKDLKVLSRPKKVFFYVFLMNIESIVNSSEATIKETVLLISSIE